MMSLGLFNLKPLRADGDQSIEIDINGKLVEVPSIAVNGRNIVVQGRWVKIAVIHEEEWLENQLENIDVLLRRLKESRSSGFRADIFTFAQKLPDTTPKYAYPRDWDSIASIGLTTFQDWWEKLPQESRKNVRRAQKRGVDVRQVCLDDTLVQGLVELNNDSPIRQGRPYAHYGKSFEQVKKDQSTYLDRSDLVGAYCGDELIGFLKVIYCGNTASILQLLPKASHSDKRPANALMAKAVELAAAKGMSHLVFGKFHYRTKGDSTLREFKCRHGFEEVLVPRYYIPLTAWGALCRRAKFYRPLADMLPSNVIRLGLALRSRWYRVKHAYKPV